MDALTALAPIAIALACPIAMFVMMRGMHDGHRGGCTHEVYGERRERDRVA